MANLNHYLQLISSIMHFILYLAVNSMHIKCESNQYFSTVKKYRIFSLVTDTIYIFTVASRNYFFLVYIPNKICPPCDLATSQLSAIDRENRRLFVNTNNKDIARVKHRVLTWNK